MSEKKYLDLAGLQYYDSKWKFKFDAIAMSNSDIDDLWTDIMNDPNRSWSITIFTHENGEIPFCLYGYENVSMTVNWGDGTTETYTSNDAEEGVCINHAYSNEGTYTIVMSSNDFARLHISCADEYATETYQYTLRRINSPLPKLAGCYYSGTEYDDQLSHLFYECYSLSYIPDYLFKNNQTATDFNRCFDKCDSLTSIPENIFSGNSVATNFEACFNECEELTSIPENLFKDNVAATNFFACFSVCTSVQSIPENLFKYNVSAIDFGSCFSHCDAVTSLPKNLFKSTVNATNFKHCFYGCDTLQTVSSGLFANAISATTYEGCFALCNLLKDFHLKIGSSNVTTFSNFIPNASNVDRILCVPDSSRTYTSANSIANANNGIIVSTISTDCITPVLEFGINTEASASGEKKTGIPFNLYGQYGITLTVDWGDGTASTLTSANYTELNTRASVHEYAIPGAYTVTISSNNWENTYILDYNVYGGGYIGSDQYDAEAALYWWRRTLVELCDELPPLAGVNGYTYGAENFDENTEDVLWSYNNRFDNLFAYCEKITSIPETLFANNTGATDLCSLFLNCGGITSIPSGLLTNLTELINISGIFESCYHLTAIPETLFSTNTKLYNVDNAFASCNALNGFTLHIVSTRGGNVSSFVTKKEGVVRTVYVPSGSATQTKFNAVASSLGLTIIGE